MNSRIIVAFDGSNNSGKSTFINILKKDIKNASAFELNANNKILNREWWFYKSSPMQLIEELMYMVIERKKQIDDKNTRIILLDKGKRTISARIFATLKLRGLNDCEIHMYVNEFEKRYDNIMDEDIHVYMENMYFFEEELFLNQYDDIQRSVLRSMKYDVKNFMNNATDFPGDDLIYKVKQIISLYEMNVCKVHSSKLLINIIGLSNFKTDEAIAFNECIKKYGKTMVLDINNFVGCIAKKNDNNAGEFLYYEFLMQDVIDNIKSYEGILVLLNIDRNHDKILKNIFECRYIYLNRLEKYVRNCTNMRDVFIIAKKKIMECVQFNNLDVRGIETLDIPCKYRNIITYVINNIKNSAKNNLVLISVVGSCAFKSVIDGWSDIDILIIINEQDDGFVQYITNLSNKYSIHVGVNCFTLYEINNLKVDMKNKWNLYYLQKGYICPIYYSEEFQIPKLSFCKLIKEERIFVEEYRFLINRMIFSESFQPRDLLKALITYTKIILRQNHIISTNIYETMTLLKIIWNIDYQKYFEIDDLVNLKIESIRMFAINIMNCVS